MARRPSSIWRKYPLQLNRASGAFPSLARVSQKPKLRIRSVPRYLKDIETGEKPRNRATIIANCFPPGKLKWKSTMQRLPDFGTWSIEPLGEGQCN